MPRPGMPNGQVCCTFRRRFASNNRDCPFSGEASVNVRFQLMAPGGWYVPKISHKQEMEFREELMREDQALLTVKRNAKRQGSKMTEPAQQLLQFHYQQTW